MIASVNRQGRLLVYTNSMFFQSKSQDFEYVCFIKN